jgi:hypothetical protein
MRVIVASTFAPLSSERADRLAGELAEALAERGHDVERVRIPFVNRQEHLLEQMLAMRLTDISDDGDLLIALGVSAHLLRHQRKVVWLVDGPESDAWFARTGLNSYDQQVMLLRDAVIAADELALSEAQRVFVGSAGVSRSNPHVRRFGAEVLEQPVEDGHSEGPWDDIVAALTGDR